MNNFSADDIKPQNDKVIIVTGGNSGLGFESVKALCAKGASVIMGSRNQAKAEEAIQKISHLHPRGKVEFIALDLASLDSVRQFATSFKKRHDRLDVLMNNAGLMAIPHQITKDGFEMQLGTNHLGHFVLTNELLDVLLGTQDSRVVSITSLASNTGRINFKDLMSEKFYNRWIAYGQSKLANMLFAQELQRRFQSKGSDTISVMAHPGFSATNLQDGPALEGGLIGKLSKNLLLPMCQPQDQGALPQLYAATASDVKGGDYIGPDGFFEMRGEPKKVDMPRNGRNKKTALKLWQLSEALTGARYTSL